MNKTERIALCFYGQPRGVEEHYNNVSNFISNNCKNYSVDIFVHTWWDPSVVGQSYQCASWSKTPDTQRIIKSDTIDVIKKLYNPIKIVYEKPNLFEDDVKNVKEMAIYHSTTCEGKRGNVSNMFSNIYSKYKVSELLKQHIEETNSKYKVVISLRFDYNHKLSVFNPDTCLENKLYQFYFDNRIFVADPLVFFTNTDYFINYSQTYVNIKKINESQECKDAAATFGIEFSINVEEIITLNLRLYYSEDEIKNSFIYLY